MPRLTGLTTKTCHSMVLRSEATAPRDVLDRLLQHVWSRDGVRPSTPWEGSRQVVGEINVHKAN